MKSEKHESGDVTIIKAKPYAVAPNEDKLDSDLDSGKIVTTISRNFGGTGFVRFGNGLTIQWGAVEPDYEHQTTTGIVTLPVEFRSLGYKVVATTDSDVVGNYGAVNIRSSGEGGAWTEGTFGWKRRYYQDNFKWIAIGY